MEVAKQRYGLDILINDPDYHVRICVVREGYELNKLINDPDKYVRDTVIRYCERHKDEEECKNILMLENL